MHGNVCNPLLEVVERENSPPSPTSPLVSPATNRYFPHCGIPPTLEQEKEMTI